MEFLCNPENLKDELKLLINLFDTKRIKKIDFNLDTSNGEFDCTITIFGNRPKRYNYTMQMVYENEKQFTQRNSKNCLYKALSSYLHSSLTWGSLTGIRPSKIYKEIVAELAIKYPNKSYDEILDLAEKEIQDRYFVSKDKAKILKTMLLTQGEYLAQDHRVHLYINIPFCPTRCQYCSFVACGVDKFSHLIDPYLDALCKEIKATLEFIVKNKYYIDTIYIGGGTPTSLSAENLDKLLSMLSQLDVKEFTVEAGRPDTITVDKLKVLKNHGVTRISINPQSFSDKTLISIGRRHTSSDILDAYNIAKPFGFNINMDLIAGLDGEKFKDFKKSLNTCLLLNPTDITVHTLSIKNTSNLKLNGGKTSNAKVVGKMVNYAYDELSKYGYNPYYLYRQKNMVGNHENIGYTRNLSCVFNIISMEELASVVACGANAISKKYTISNNRIDRFACVKNINDYITRIDELIEKKLSLFKGE